MGTPLPCLKVLGSIPRDGTATSFWGLLFREVWLGNKVLERLVVSLDCEVLSIKVMSPGTNKVYDGK